MASLRAGCAIAVFSTVVGGCASTYAPNDLPPPRDFSVDDMAVGGSGGNGGDDLADRAGGDLAAADLAAAAAHDLATADLSTVHDLAQGCVDDGDGGVVPTLWMAAPTASGWLAARLRGGTWATVTTTAGGAVDAVALAAVGGQPLVAAKLHDTTLAAATFDGCHDRFGALAAIAAAASTAARPALVGGGTTGDVVFRGSVNGDQRYYWAHFDGAAWGAIATQGNFLSTLAPTAVQAGGAVHALFAGTDTNLYDGVVQVSGGGTSTKLTGNTSSLAPAAAVAPGGAVHVLYTGTNQHIYWFLTSAPATVHDLCDGQPSGCFIITDAAPAIAFGSDGNAVALWHGTDNKLYASRLSGTQWGAAAAISGSDSVTLAPAVTGGVGGSIADVVYARSDGTPRHAQLTASGWQAPVSVAPAAITGAPALATTP